MGHLLFCVLHLCALLFGFIGLFLTIPLHLIYGAIAKNRKPTEVKPGTLKGIGVFVLALFLIGVVVDYADDKKQAKAKKKETEITAKIEANKKIRRDAEKQKKETEKQKFIAEIDGHYQKVISLKDQGQLEQALEITTQFDRYKLMGHQDIQTIHREIKTTVLHEKVKKVPASDPKKNMFYYRELLNLNPDNELFAAKFKKYQDRFEKEQKRATADLEILNWRWFDNGSYAVAKGEVKNISNYRIDRAMAVVTWFDDSGMEITQDSSYIELTALMPDQVSEFKVMERWNPAMHQANLKFRTLRGGDIKTFHDK